MHKSIVKVIILIICILVTIFISEYACQKYLSVTAERLEKKVATIEDHIKNEKWDELDGVLKDLNTDWDSVEKIWAICIDHFEIDNIDNAFVRMDRFIESKSSKEALAEAGSLRKYLDHIPRKTALSLENFLILRVK